MSDISRSETLRANERIKHATGALTAWANALVIAAFAKMGFAGGFDLYAFLWLLGALWVIWISSIALTMLKAEGEI